MSAAGQLAYIEGELTFYAFQTAFARAGMVRFFQQLNHTRNLRQHRAFLPSKCVGTICACPEACTSARRGYAAGSLPPQRRSGCCTGCRAAPRRCARRSLRHPSIWARAAHLFVPMRPLAWLSPKEKLTAFFNSLPVQDV